MSIDRMRTILEVEPLAGGDIRLCWSDGTDARAKLPDDLQNAGAPTLGDWGHSVAWPNGVELGADTLWLRTLSAIGRDDARQFLEWRLRNGLSLSKAADALGLARRTIAYYSNGERPVPKAILLACTGWEVGHHLQKAA